MSRLYFAYGSNLWHAQMARRCPGAMLMGLGRLMHFRWVISERGYANILMSHDDDVWGLVWSISPENEAALDRYEGVAQGSYVKYDLEVLLEASGEEQPCLVYVDPAQAEGRPWAEYVERMNAGLADAHLPEQWVQKYVRAFIPAPPPPRKTPSVAPSSVKKPDKKPTARFYFAYGVDLWNRQLITHAPGARVLDVGKVLQYRWMISERGHPNLERSARDHVYGLVSSITEDDEKRLDVLNGVRTGICRKHYLRVEMEKGRGNVTCIVYIDPRIDDGIPAEGVVKKMQEGLWEANLPVEWVEASIRPYLIPPS